MSAFKPAEWFIGAVELFGVLLPGGVTLYLARIALVGAGWLPETSWPTGVLGWASFLVLSFILGYLAHPPAHVLNRLYDRVYAERRRRDGDPALEYVRSAARREVSPKDSLYAWAKSEVGASSREALARIELLEGVSKMFRTLTLLSVLAGAVTLIAEQWTYSAILLLVAVASFLVFAERRFAATKEVYQRFRRVHEQKGPSTIIMSP